MFEIFAGVDLTQLWAAIAAIAAIAAAVFSWWSWRAQWRSQFPLITAVWCDRYRFGGGTFRLVHITFEVCNEDRWKVLRLVSPNGDRRFATEQQLKPAGANSDIEPEVFADVAISDLPVQSFASPMKPLRVKAYISGHSKVFAVLHDAATGKVRQFKVPLV